MKRMMTLVIALMISGFAFSQKPGNPLVSERNYKHPFAAKAAKKNNVDRSEKFATETVAESGDYKHPNRKAKSQSTRLRQGNDVSPAASTKHPFGS